MEADEWFILVLIDALVAVPLHFTVIKYYLSQSEKQYLNDIEIYFAIFVLIFVISIVILKKSLSSRQH